MVVFHWPQVRGPHRRSGERERGHVRRVRAQRSMLLTLILAFSSFGSTSGSRGQSHRYSKTPSDEHSGSCLAFSSFGPHGSFG